MRIVFREDHLLFAEQVERFVSNEILPHYADWEKQGITPRSLWQKAGAAGLLNCALPAPYGQGGDFGHSAVVIEALARANCLGIGFSIHSDMVSPYIWNFGDAEQKDRWLPLLASGDRIGALAISEAGAGSDLKAIQSRAVRHGDHYLLNGQKTFITNGVNAGIIVALVSTAPELGARGMSLLVLEEGMPGLSKGPALSKIGQHSQDTCEFFFSDVRVPLENLLGSENSGFEYVSKELAQERLAIALRAAASMEGMMKSTADYVRDRKVFGRRLLDYQNTRFKFADFLSKAAMLRVFLDDCLKRHIAGQLDSVTAAMAKLNATELQGQVLDELLQLHGGYGYMAEYGIGRAWADARALRIFGGTSEILREIIGKRL